MGRYGPGVPAFRHSFIYHSLLEIIMAGTWTIPLSGFSHPFGPEPDIAETLPADPVDCYRERLLEQLTELKDDAEQTCGRCCSRWLEESIGIVKDTTR
jgi:hypothetical protein